MGLDLGTSGCKAAVYRAEGQVVARASVRYPTYADGQGRAEQAPEDWWRAARAAILHVAEGSQGLGTIGAIGLSGQVGSITPVDLHGREVMARVATWQDRRAASEVATVEEAFPPDRLDQWLGIGLPPGTNWPLPRLSWWRRSEPEAWARTRYLLQAKDYVGWRLTGKALTDASSWRGLVHLPEGADVPELFAYLGLAADVLPERRPPDSSRGSLGAEVAKTVGFSCEVAVGWNDLNCAGLGASLERGEGFDIAGTSDHLGMVVEPETKTPSAALISAPFLPDRQLVYGVTAASGGAFEWVRGLLTQVGREADEGFTELGRLAADLSPGAEGLVFLPHLAGERSPWWDPEARGALIGLTQAHRAEHVLRAVMEGVALHLESVRRLLPAWPRGSYVKAAGGPTQIQLWNQIRADVFGVSLWVADDPDLSCRGAAMLAARLAGVNPAQLACRWTVVAPDPERHARYAALFPVFAEVYPRLRELFHALSRWPSVGSAKPGHPGED